MQRMIALGPDHNPLGRLTCHHFGYISSTQLLGVLNSALGLCLVLIKAAYLDIAP